MTKTFLALAILLLTIPGFAQREHWRTPYPAFTIAGNVHYVGTEGLACYLITTPEGHILINTGFEDSVPLIKQGTEKLGYKFDDIKILLTMQAHSDHIAGFPDLQKQTGAKVFATEGDAPDMGVKVDRKLKDGDSIKLGKYDLKVILTPGHTKGSVSYAMDITDKGKTQKLLFANMSTVVAPLVNNADYPNIVDDYRRTFIKQKSLTPDIWLAAHGEHFHMKEKHKAGNFVDPEGYKAAILEYEKLFQDKLKQ